MVSTYLPTCLYSYYLLCSHSCNVIAEAESPPLHAINRGIGTEGFGTMLAGLWGAGNGTNTFGENVGAIGVTKVNYYILKAPPVLIITAI